MLDRASVASNLLSVNYNWHAFATPGPFSLHQKFLRIQKSDECAQKILKVAVFGTSRLLFGFLVCSDGFAHERNDADLDRWYAPLTYLHHYCCKLKEGEKNDDVNTSYLV